MAGLIARGNIPRLLQEGVRDVFGRAYDEHPAEWNRMFQEDDSMKSFEIDVQLEGFSLATPKDEGGDLEFDSQRQGFTPIYPHITYGKGFNVSRENLEDELYGQFSTRAQALAFSMTQTKETVAANIFNNGFNSSFQMDSGDGQPLFSQTHPNGPSDSNTYSNVLATPADLTEASLEDLLIQIGQARDPRDLQIRLIGQLLIIPVPEQFNATRIMKSVLQNDTGNNAVNAMREMGMLPDGMLVNHYLTDLNAFFIRTNSPTGLRYFTRRAVEFGEDMSFSTENTRFKATERYSFGWTDARGAYGSQGST